MKRILVIKLCCLGDIMQMPPMLGSLRQKYPDAQIDFLASTWVYEIISRFPELNRFIPWNEPYEPVSKIRKAASALRTVKILRQGRYGMAVIAHRSPLFGLLARLAGIPKVIGFGSKPFYTHPVPFQDNLHESERFLSLAQAAGGDLHAPPMRLEIRPEDALAAKTLAQETGIARHDDFVCLFPGGGNNPGTRMPIKQWPKEKWTELIKKLPSSQPILLLGDSLDASITAGIKSRLPDSLSVHNLAGKTSFSALTGLLSKASLVIGGDSGPLYVASALGRPTLMLFGPSDPRLVAPQVSNTRYLWKQVSCSPCYTPQTSVDWKRYVNGEFPCHTGTHACMKELSVEEVVQAATDLRMTHA